MENEEYFKKFKENFLQQIKDAYMEGAHQGAILTTAIIFTTMRKAGLEEDNILFDILKDIAKTHGCEDLPTYAKEFQKENDKPEDKYLS